MSISIVTTCLNSVATLEHTIQSVQDQSYKNIEFIVIDGASADGTLEIIKRRSDAIDFWISEKDSSVSEAVNKGIKKATGDIVFCLPSDDFIDKDFCKKLADCFEEHGDRADYVYGDVQMCDAKGNALYKVVEQRINYFGIKKSVFEEIGYFDERLALNNDVDFLQRMDQAGKRGVYCDLIRFMRMGGASEKGRFKGLWLLLQIEIKNGRSFSVAFVRYGIRLCLFGIEKLIRFFFGLKGVFSFYDLKYGLKRKLGINW